MKTTHWSNVVFIYALFMTALPAMSQTAELNRGLIAYYPFNENAKDLSGPNHGEIHGARISSARCDDFAYYFDGEDDYIECGNHSSLNGNFHGFSISVWIRPGVIGSNEFGTIVGKWGFDPRKDHFGLWINENYKIVAAVGEPTHMENGIFSNTMLEVDEWYHVVATWHKSRKMRIYINGQLDKEGLQTGHGINQNSLMSLKIGRQVVRMSRAFKGYIDELRLYNRSLSPNDVMDIYQFDKAACEKIYLTGQVINKSTGQPVDASVVFEDLSDGEEFKIIQTKGKQATYKTTMPIGYQLGMFAKAENYMPVTEKLDTRRYRTNQTVVQDLYVVPFEVGQTLVLNNLFFDTGQSTLRRESYAELKRLLTFFALFPNMVIEIAGHTDNVGTDLNNQSLSENRADAVRNYLLQHEINSSSVMAKGYGETAPVASNNTTAGRQKNRRVEFKIVSK